MSRDTACSQWSLTVATHVPHVSTPQATVLALWRSGIVVARSCALTAVVVIVAPVLTLTDNTLCQRRRAWCDAAADTQGTQRQQVDVTTCVPPLLTWMLRGWTSAQRAWAMEATTLGDRCVVLGIRSVYRGWAIPVAWTV
jgi:hypothetical protein